MEMKTNKQTEVKLLLIRKDTDRQIDKQLDKKTDILVFIYLFINIYLDTHKHVGRLHTT